ncbi:cytochrome P450 6B1 [Nasonia vitripennis]|uniref:Cytochrome P450 n=1 Tax=Nasonia vitripennis TaxID=7425 RepID=A0A7M7G4Y3_NASVI|nr:cytochrome P450 6B1 [Nasonia vitripennis]
MLHVNNKLIKRVLKIKSSNAMEVGTLEIIIGLSVLSFIFHYYLTYHFDFWKKQNVVGPKPIPFFGNVKEILFGEIHAGLLMKRYYDQYKSEPMIGIYGNRTPSLILKDPSLIKDVMIRDFNVFPDRGFYVNAKADPVNQNLANLEHARWRPLRTKLTPIFTSGKLKEMFYLLVECANSFEKYVEKLIEKDEPVEVRELTSKFTIQAIGVCVLGLDTKALEENSQFRTYGRALFVPTIVNVGRILLQQLAPWIYESLGPFKTSEPVRFFAKSTKEIVEYRRKNKIRRNDFVGLLMDLQDQPNTLSNIDFSDEFLAGQILAFFAAGFETSSTTVSNALYELAFNQNIQDKLRNEIREEIERNNGQLTYDSIKRMKYLDKIYKETLRKYPPGSIIQRRSNAQYTFTGTKVTIPANTTLIIPVWAIHRDPDLYPDPDIFDPERFNEDNESSRHPMNYLPFGDGPHNCIAVRYSNYQTKVGLIAAINKFKVNVCDKTCISYQVEPRAIFTAPVGGIYLKISKVL